MCRLLEVSRILLCYHLNKKESDASDEESKIEKHIIDIFQLRCNYSLKDIKVFHSDRADRGKEYDNIKIDNILETFNIERSSLFEINLLKKGLPF